MKAVHVPLLLFALPAIVIAAIGPLADAMLLTRDGIGAGQLWRLWTGHWVHFSSSHLGWNLGVMVLAGAELESRRPGSLWHYTAIAAPLISLSLLIGQPTMTGFGGLSALATGVVVLLGLALQCEAGKDRLVGLGLLALVALKLGHDLLQPLALFSQFDSLAIRPAALSHVAGAAIALLYHGLARRSARRSHLPERTTRLLIVAEASSLGSPRRQSSP